MMSWEQVAKVRDAGMTIGAHSVSHPNLAWLPPAAQEAQMRESKLALSSHLGIPVRHFSYPSPIDPPCLNRDSMAAARQVGFAAALSTFAGMARPGSNRFALPRMNQPAMAARTAGFSACFLRAALKMP